jgi:glucose-1-phosphate adenylyltransferase
VLSADHVYRFDFNEALASHRDRGAECTVVTNEVPIERAHDHATVVADDDGRVTDFAYKPDDPTTGTVATEVFVYEPQVLVEVLEQLHRELGPSAGAGDTGLGDYGESLVPRLVERGRTFAHPMPGYWRDLGQPHLYLQAHRDLLHGDPGLFRDPDWPILSQQPQRVPARLADGASVSDSLVSPGATVAGDVRRSVVGPGVVVEDGAVVADSVLLADVHVARDARVHWAVVDTRSRVGVGALVGDPDDGDADDPAHVTLVGRDCVVADGSRVAVGARLEPGTTG